MNTYNNASEREIINSAINLAEKCRYDKEHSHQVTLISLMLFDSLKELHQLGDREKLLLHIGAILHDIGWIEGQQDHHKTSRDLIINSELAGITDEERTIVALIARYHRGSMPKKSHIFYSKLNKESREILDRLSALVRLADGLDNTHMSLVKNMECEILPDQVIVKIYGGYSEIDEANAAKKSDLFEKTFNRKIILRWNASAHPDRKLA